MNFQQLRIIRAALRHDLNLTEVADALHTSQSGVSKHIKDLEDELGVEIFVRHGKRLTGVTAPGRELAVIVERILLDTANIKNLAEQFASRDEGQLVIATTHTQARYALPPVVTKFRQEFPKVKLVLREASPTEIVDMLVDGAADIGMATEALGSHDELVSFPYYSWHHGVVVQAGHPLVAKASRRLGLADIAAYPIITYHTGFTRRACIDEAFATAGLEPQITMAAIDADVIKAYVALGMGVGIIASMAFDAGRDGGLALLDASHLFAKSTSRIAVRRGAYLRRFAHTFLEMCQPDLDEKTVKTALRLGADEDIV